MEKVAVVIPFYNANNEWLFQAAASIALQTYKNTQLIVVDDGSTTKTHLLNKIKKSSEVGGIIEGTFFDMPITYAQYAERHGQSFARNVGVKITPEDVKYIAFLDADDIYVPEKIEKSIALFTEPIVGFVYSDCSILDVDNDVAYIEYLQAFSGEALLNNCVGHCAAVVRREIFDEVGGFDEELFAYEDFDLWCRIGKKYIGLHIPEVLYHVRQSKTNLLRTIEKDCLLYNKERALVKTKWKKQ